MAPSPTGATRTRRSNATSALPHIRLRPAPGRRGLVCPRCRGLTVHGHAQRGASSAEYRCTECRWHKHEHTLSDRELAVLVASSLT